MIEQLEKRISKGMKGLRYNNDHLDLIHIYRTVHQIPTTKNLGGMYMGCLPG